MSLLLKCLLGINNSHLKRYKKLLSSVALSLCALSSGIQTAQAEGSRTLYPSSASSSSNRANIEWRTDTYGGLVLRRTLLKVYANKDEYILLGSSAVRINNGDIRVYNPGSVSGSIGSEIIPNTPNFLCSSQAGQGFISTRQQELNGPRAISGGGNPNGYIPCYYKAPSTGVYNIVFYGPDGGNAANNLAPTGEIPMTSANNFNDQQGTNVAAWDVTVRSSDTSTTDLDGRLFSYYLALYTGNNGLYLNFPVYPVTTDGFQYKVELRGTDPNGFVLYGNQVGFFDSDGKSPLYHDILGTDSQLTSPQGGVSLARPQYATFFNSIDASVLPYVERYQPNGILDGTGIPLSPFIPVFSTLQFNGTVTGNNSSYRTGGTFNFSSNVTAPYKLIISRDGSNFDPSNSQNRLLSGTMTANQQQTVSWDGKDNSGNFFPVGSNYKVRVTTIGGEYHFPLLDAENNFTGGPTITMLNASNPLGNTRAFYDDRGYQTINGTQVGTSGQVLCGINPPNPAFFSDPFNGFDTTSNDRKFGQSGNAGNAGTSCNGSFGDTKGLDLWTYYRGQSQPTPLNIIDAVSPNVGKVIINEVLYNETGTATNTNDEFIELYNASSSTVDLSGFKLADGHLTANDNDGTNGFTYIFPNGTTLQAGKYAVIWIGDNNVNHQATGAAFQAWLAQTPKLNNSGDDIWLYDNQDKVIDYIAYGAGSEVNTPPSSLLNLWDNTYQSSLIGVSNGQSISLTPNGQDTNVSACWEATTSNNAKTRCPNYLPTRDTDNTGSRITSVGESNNGAIANLTPKLLLVKRITRINNQDITDIVDGRSDVAITAANYVSAPDDTDDDSDKLWPVGYLRGLINAGTVHPQDILEYTIYFLSSGNQSITNVNICDLVPQNVTFIPSSFTGNTPTDGGLLGADSGIALTIGSTTKYLTNVADAPDRGQFFLPGTIAPGSCNKNNPGTPLSANENSNGAVVVNVVTKTTPATTQPQPDEILPNATTPGTPNSYGFIRFRAKVK